MRTAWKSATWAVIGGAFLLAACETPGSWQNPDVPKEQWSNDRADCQARARQQVEREAALRSNTSPSVRNDANQQWVSQMDRFSGTQREQELTQQCLINKGYRFVQEDKDQTTQ